MTSARELATALLLFMMVVLCAWAYPKLNGWVYRRRLARDLAAARPADNGRGLAGPPPR